MKKAYVTGGASGIGGAVAEMLAKRGIQVAVADWNYIVAQAVASSISGAMAVEADVADWSSHLNAFKQILQEFERINYVYAIARIGERRWMPNDPQMADFVKPDHTVLDVDLDGVLYTVALAVQQMRRQDPDEHGFRGKIAVAASSCGFYYVPTLPIYTAAKHGVVGFVRSFGKHLPTEAITLNAICPNLVRTNISTSAFYDQMESRNLIVPMEFVVEGFEKCLETDMSGETLEIDPHTGIRHRTAPAPFDTYATDLLGQLHQRSRPLQQPDQQ